MAGGHQGRGCRAPQPQQLFEGDTNDQEAPADAIGHGTEGGGRNHRLGSPGLVEAQDHTAKLSWGLDPGLWSVTRYTVMSISSNTRVRKPMSKENVKNVNVKE